MLNKRHHSGKSFQGWVHSIVAVEPCPRTLPVNFPLFFRKDTQLYAMRDGTLDFFVSSAIASITYHSSLVPTRQLDGFSADLDGE